MSHRISEEEVGYDAAAVLQEWFEGYMTRSDGRQYKVVQVEHDGLRMVVEVRGTQYLDVEEEQFEVEVSVRRTDR
jgi:hypothetical protein